ILGVSGPPTNTTFVQAAYKQLLPTWPVSPGEINFYVNLLNTNQLSTGQVAFSLLTSSLYRFDLPASLIPSAYQKYLGRPILPPELSFWRLQYAGGRRNEEMIGTLLDSGEYFNNHIGTATTLQAKDTNWTNGVYNDLFGRTTGATPSELSASL